MIDGGSFDLKWLLDSFNRIGRENHCAVREAVGSERAARSPKYRRYRPATTVVGSLEAPAGSGVKVRVARFCG